MAVHIKPFAEIENELKTDWESTTIGVRNPWDEVWPDARFGYEQAQNPEFEGANFEDVHNELERRWENMPHPDYADWRVSSEVVKLGFDRAKEEMEEEAA